MHSSLILQIYQCFQRKQISPHHPTHPKMVSWIITCCHLENVVHNIKYNELIVLSLWYLHKFGRIPYISSCDTCIYISSWDILQTSTLWLKFDSLSPTVTLKIMSRSTKPNYLFTMSQGYIHANLVKIWQPVHEISCKQESVKPTPTPTWSASKTICPPPLQWGNIKMVRSGICICFLLTGLNEQFCG